MPLNPGLAPGLKGARNKYLKLFEAIRYIYIYIYICNELIEETAWHKMLIFACGSLLAMAPLSSELRAKCRLIMEL